MIFNYIIIIVYNFLKTTISTNMDIKVVGCILSISFHTAKFILLVSSFSMFKIEPLK